MTNATQIIILGVFIFFLVVAVIVFAFLGRGSGVSNGAPVVIWGTIPEEVLARASDLLNTTNPGSIKIQYTAIAPDKFEDTLVNALADNTGPDAVILPDDLLFVNRKRLAVIGYNVYPERNFKDSFIGASEVLLTSKGSYGLPLLADPLVMYWNRDILSSEGVAKPPKTWEQALALVPRISEINDDKTIKRSAIGLGDFRNVNHGKAILSALMIQAGSKMVVWDGTDSAINYINNSGAKDSNPVQEAFQFFTEFSNPGQKAYSWNRSLPNTINYFGAGDLALYFGLASDLPRIRTLNPNLNFDMAPLPQPATSENQKTSASVWSFAILNSARNEQAALNAIVMLTGPSVVSLASSMTGLSPARRDLLSQKQSRSSLSITFESALFASTWLDPDRDRSSAAFASAVESIVTGQSTIADASNTFSKQIDEILRK